MKTPTDCFTPELAANLAALLQPVQPPSARTAAMRARLLQRAHAAAQPDPHLTLRADEGRWRTLGTGIDMKILRREPGTVSYLLRMAAGMRVPAHDHDTDEECLVLEGEVWLGTTHAFAGDYHLARQGIPHGELHTESGCLLFLRGPRPEASAHHA
jgi:anti-sigma factor ChrR (cupin superfamily)